MKGFTYKNEWPIDLNSIEAVKDFVEKSKDVPFDIDMRRLDRPTCVDAKSIMGIFSLDLSKPHFLCTNAEGPEVEKYKAVISKYLL